MLTMSPIILKPGFLSCSLKVEHLPDMECFQRLHQDTPCNCRWLIFADAGTVSLSDMGCQVLQSRLQPRPHQMWLPWSE